MWTSYAYDMRGTGQPDVPLGTDREAALRRWAEMHLDAPRIAGSSKRHSVHGRNAASTPGLTARRAPPRRSAATASACTPFGGARWEDNTMPVLRQYVQARSAKGRARQEMQLLSVIWDWARLDGMTALPWPATGMQRSGWKGAQGVWQIEVSDAAFAALHRHADQCLRDALDIASACGLRVMDVLGLRLSDVRGGELVSTAGKTGKRGEFDLAASLVLQPIIDRRRAMRGVDHRFLLAAGAKPVTYRMLAARFDKARAAASKEVPECAAIWLRDMRKYAGQLAPDLHAASKLLQHGSLSTTRQSHRQGDKLKPAS